MLYHLALEGWTDLVLIEKDELTSGATWHAAGLIPHFIGNLNMAKVHAYGASLYQSLESDTGHHTGWHGCGALRLATRPDEVDWLKSVKGILDLVGVEAYLLGPNEVAAKHPLLDVSDVKLAVHTPGDGWTDPAMSTNAIAAAARQLGAEIILHNRVTGMRYRPDRRWEIETSLGSITTDHVVNAAGHYGPQVAAMAGFALPVVSIIHQYLVTEAIPEVAELGFEPPVTRDPRASCYLRREHDGMIIGPYETEGARTWGTDGVDWGLSFHLTPPDIERLAPWVELAARRIPVLGNAGIKRVVSGPITHTPDGGFLMGPAPGLVNHWVCGGASIGITQGPGAGKYLAQWMAHGQTEINVRDMDPRRFGSYALGRYAIEKAVDEYHEMYQVRRPGEYRAAGRPLKQTPLYKTLDSKGARWQEIYGWERAQYFPTDGSSEAHSFRRSNAFPDVAREVRGIRERVGVAELTAFTKLEVKGADASALLDRLAANRIPTRIGGIRLVHMLTEKGGIECEMTVVRLADYRFYLNSAIVAQQHDTDWIRSHIGRGESVEVVDVTDELGILAVVGPQSRAVLSALTDAPLDSSVFPWLTSQELVVAGVPCRAMRVSYAGELGWELHHSLEESRALYDAVVDAGRRFDAVDFGSYALDALRLEKAYKAWGSELTTEVTPVEAGLMRFVDLGKEFIGRAAVLRRNEEGPATVCVYGAVEAGDADCRGNEPIYARHRIIGLTTSGAYGHSVDKSLFFAYVEPAFAEAGTEFEIEVLGERRRAAVLPEAAWDPRNDRLRA